MDLITFKHTSDTYYMLKHMNYNRPEDHLVYLFLRSIKYYDIPKYVMYLYFHKPMCILNLKYLIYLYCEPHDLLDNIIKHYVYLVYLGYLETVDIPNNCGIQYTRSGWTKQDEYDMLLYYDPSQ